MIPDTPGEFPSKRMDRRHFVQHSALAAVGAGGWMTGLRELVERARLQDRPVLTDANFNTFLRDLRARGSTTRQQFVAALRADMRKTIRDRFTLTQAQYQRLGTFTETQKSTIVAAFDRGLTGSNDIVVAMPNKGYVRPCIVTAARTLKQLDGGRTAELWTLTFTE